MVNDYTGNQASKRAAMVVATMASFLMPFMVSSVNVALPSIGQEFALDAVTLGWVPTSYLLASAIFLLPFGRIADIYGRKRIFTYGIVIFTASSFLLGLSPSAVLLISFRVLQGIGAAMTFSTAIPIITSVFPAGERGKVLGINVASVYIGLSLGPTLGGVLTQNFGWRSIFFVSVIMGLATIISILWKLKGEWAEAKGEKFDFIGSIIYGLALAAIIYGFSLLPAIAGIWLTVIGILGILAFIWWELKSHSPVLNINIFRHNPVFFFSNLAALINYCATSAIGFLLSLYLQYIKVFSPAHAGLILLSMPALQAIFSPLAGRLSDKIEPRILASLGMALTTVGLSLFIFLNDTTALIFIIGNLMLLGFGFAMFSSPNTNAVMGSVERKSYGVASGILGTMRVTGQMFGLGIAMLLLALYIGRVQITHEYYLLFLKSAKTAFAIFAVLCFGGIFASLARGRAQREF